MICCCGSSFVCVFVLMCFYLPSIFFFCFVCEPLSCASLRAAIVAHRGKRKS